MPWYAEQGNGQNAVLRKSAKSPGPGWVLIPGATDAMTEDQAAQQLLQDILHGDFGSSVWNGVRKVTQAAANATGLTGLAAVGDFFSKLGQPNTWLRVAEVTVGLVLLAVALNKVLGNPAGSAVKLAAKVP
jgi:hypothetical protein